MKMRAFIKLHTLAKPAAVTLRDGKPEVREANILGASLRPLRHGVAAILP
jgi:hypothetical protein